MRLDFDRLRRRDRGTARDVQAELRNLAADFEAELTALAERTVLERVVVALTGKLVATTTCAATRRDAKHGTARTRQPASPGPTSNRASHRFAPPLSLKVYEREVLLRELDEVGGDARRAGKLLGLPKSSIYRHLIGAGISSRSPEKPQGFANHLPLSQEAFEREVLSRAIAASGGDNLAAARKLGMSKSTSTGGWRRSERAHGARATTAMPPPQVRDSLRNLPSPSAQVARPLTPRHSTLANKPQVPAQDGRPLLAPAMLPATTRSGASTPNPDDTSDSLKRLPENEVYEFEVTGKDEGAANEVLRALGEWLDATAEAPRAFLSPTGDGTTFEFRAQQSEHGHRLFNKARNQALRYKDKINGLRLFTGPSRSKPLPD